MMRHFRIQMAKDHRWIEAVVANIDQMIEMVQILESSDLVENYTVHEAGIHAPLEPWHAGLGGMETYWKKWVNK